MKMKKKFTQEEIEKAIKEAVKNGNNEDAVLMVIYKLSTPFIFSYKETLLNEDAILEILNEYLTIPFTLEDLQISLKILQQKKMITSK
jgi:helix-turn-helix protein